ncbi:MAG: SDR family oxidoreductase [Thermoanaerobaculia bacterium]
MGIRGQVAWVTGASRGIGRATALALARAGARVALSSRDAAALAAVEGSVTALGGEALVAVADVSLPREVRAAAAAAEARFGGIDILINNAGVGWFRPFVDTAEDELVATLDVNLKGAILCARAVLPGMIERRRGQIVHVASDLARRPLAGMAVYAAAKHGLLGFSASLLREVKQHGVKVTAVLPGWTDTGFGGAREGSHDDRETLTPEFVAGEIVRLLELPLDWVIDELAIHPLGQTF